MEFYRGRGSEGEGVREGEGGREGEREGGGGRERERWRGTESREGEGGKEVREGRTHLTQCG